MLYNKKIFLIKIVQKKEKKQQNKSRKIKQRKTWGKMKTKQKSIKETCQGNYEKKRFYNLSNL